MGGSQRHYESREKSLLRHNNFQSDFLPQILLRNKSSEKYESSYISVFVDKTWKVLSKYHHFHFIHHSCSQIFDTDDQNTIKKIIKQQKVKK